jgi:hypothetical protein
LEKQIPIIYPECIRDRKEMHRFDFYSRASHRLREMAPPRQSKAKP